MTRNTKTFSELSRFETFEERFEYLQLNSVVGASTFGHERFLNQDFYRSREWKNVRLHVIARDNGCDLGAAGYEIHDKIIVHHMNPMSPDVIEQGNADILNPEFLISTTHSTHNAIHYGDKSLLPQQFVERSRNDHMPWRNAR